MPIKIYMSTQQGAPTMNGVAGSMITVLDAVLVNGYGSVSVTSITRTSTTATLTSATAHGLATGDTALIAGAVETDYNGEFVVTVTSATTFTYTVANSPTTPATGTITSKRAPAGFTKSFSATNKGVYRANDVSGLRHYYRFVDDGTTAGGAREARLTGYVTMSDVDTGTDLHPPSGTLTSGYFWNKTDTADSSGRHWIFITNGRTVYYFACIGSTTASGDITAPGSFLSGGGFGDIIPYKSGDSYASFVTGSGSANLFSSTQYNGLFNAATSITNGTLSTSQALITFPRDFTAVAGSRSGQVFASALSSAVGSSASISYPHTIDNGFYMAPILITQGSPSLIRGRLPGTFESLHGNCFPNTQIIENIQGFSGRKFMMVWGRNGSSSGSLVIDITGPWDS